MNDKRKSVLLDLADSIYELMITMIFDSASKHFERMYPGVNNIMLSDDVNPEVLNLTCTTNEGLDIIENCVDKTHDTIKYVFDDCDIDENDPDAEFMYQWYKDLSYTIINVYKDYVKDKEVLCLGDIAKYALIIQESKSNNVEEYCKPYLEQMP